MKKLLKISGISILILFLLLLILPYVFKGKIMKMAKEEANKNLNAKIEFKDLSLSFFRDFPKFSVRVEDFSVSGINEFENDTLFGIKSMDLAVNLASLFGESIEINSILLENPSITAHILKNGAANWDIVPEDSTTVEASAEEEPTDTSTSSFKMALKNLAINNARIVYNDEEGNMKAELVNLNFKLKGDLTTSTTDLITKTTIQALNFEMDGLNYMKNAKVDFDANIFANLDKYVFTFKENKLLINNLGLNFEGSVDVSDSVNVGMELKFYSPVNTFKSLLSLVPAIYKQDFAGLETKGKFTLSGFLKGDFNMNTYATPTFNATLKVSDGYFKYPDLPKSVNNVNITTVVSSPGGDMDNILVDVSKFHVELAQNPFDVNLHISHPMTDMVVAGKMDGKIDFSSIQDIIPLDSISIGGLLQTNVVLKAKMSDIDNENYEAVTADGDVILKNFSYEMLDIPKVNISDALLKFSPRYVDLQKFEMTMGKSDFQMNGKVENFIPYVFTDETLKGKLVLNSSIFDANEFLTGEETPEEVPENTEETDTIPLEAFGIPENIDFKFIANLKKLYYDNLKIENINGKISLLKGKLSMDNLSMEMLKGFVKLSGYYEAIDINNPGIDFDFDMKNIDIPATYKAFNTIKKLAPIAKYCNGSISAKFSLNSHLDHYLNPKYETINSKGNIQTKEIGIVDNPLFNSIAEKTKYKKFANPKLSDIDLNYTIENGNLKIEPVKLKIAGNEATIEGNQQLGGAIDYQISSTLPLGKLGQLSGQNLQNTDIKLFIGGTVAKPKIVKFESNALNSAKEEATKKVKEKVNEQAGKILANAQQQADKVIAEAEKQAKNIKEKAKLAADKLKAEADKNGKKLIKEAGSNPIKKRLAQEAAKKLNNQANDKAKKLITEADKQADNVVIKAKEKSAKILADAQKKADAYK